MRNFAQFSQEKGAEVTAVLQKKGEAKLGIFMSNKGLHGQLGVMFTDQRIIATSLSGATGKFSGFANIPYSAIIRAYPYTQEPAIVVELNNGRRAGIRYPQQYVNGELFARMLTELAAAANGNSFSGGQSQSAGFGTSSPKPVSEQESSPASFVGQKPSPAPFGGQESVPFGGQEAAQFGGQESAPFGGQNAAPAPAGAPKVGSYTFTDGPANPAPQPQKGSVFGAAQEKMAGLFGFGKKQADNGGRNQAFSGFGQKASSAGFGQNAGSFGFGQNTGSTGYGQDTNSYGYNQNAVSSPVSDAPLSYGPEMPAEENQYSFRGNYKEYFYTVLSSAFPQLRVEQLSSNRGRDAALFVLKDNTGATKAVVEVISEKSSVKLMRKRCAEQQIPYSRFYYDHHGWWNTKSYVIYRVRKAMGM